MTNSFKAAALAFSAAAALAVLGASKAAPLAAMDVCHAKVCTIELEPTVCCLLVPGSVICSPCGAVGG